MSSPRLDAELLVALALGCDRVKLYMDLDRPWSDDELTKARELLKRRRAFEPVAYIRGEREFYGHAFAVDRRVLIPRPDTETLIEAALAATHVDASVRLLDLCTGSGAIGVTLAIERPLSQVDVTDVSTDALALAKHNAERLQVVERMRFFPGDLFSALPSDARGYDLIACNPPYISEHERASLSRDILDHEPALALFAAERGLAFYVRVARDAPQWLRPGGTLLLEVGATQADEVSELLSSHAWQDVTRHHDLGGIARVVQAVRAEAWGTPPVPRGRSTATKKNSGPGPRNSQLSSGRCTRAVASVRVSSLRAGNGFCVSSLSSLGGATTNAARGTTRVTPLSSSTSTR